MNCEDLQLNLSTYQDDILTVEERAIIDEHLVRCPLCRQKSADFQALRNSLRVLSRPSMPGSLLVSIRNRVALSAGTNQPRFLLLNNESFSEWFQVRLMPYTVGTAASLLLGLTLLWTLLSAVYIPKQNAEVASIETSRKPAVLLSNTNSQSFALENDFSLNAADYAAARLTVSNDSPSLNPQGALVALTKSIVRGHMKDDEVVIVADVFGNGLAQIAEVVEPSSDVRAVRELEKALKNDPNFAPFVPASFDKRSETVRVILKINRVDIETNTKSKSDRYR